jgi:carbamoyl-phosphate synthase large subunit
LSKQFGFSDKTLAMLKATTEDHIRKRRLKLGILPVIKQIDTLAGEFDAETNYLYMTYNGETNDVRPLGKQAAIVIGSGPYCIGSSVEFDWCAVNTAKTLQRYGHTTIIVNSNPETVSTDFDRSDRLYFEELTLERIQDIADFEQPKGMVVSVGGQIANNLALPLARGHYPILGTTAADIDNAENRQKFSSMLNRLGIDQPAWQEVTDLKSAKHFAAQVDYPLLLRPSYVLSGGAMNVVRNEAEMEGYLQAATRLSPDHPVVISQFITNAKELEIDGVAKDGQLIIYAISEHIENAGVHSGDATVVYPAQRLYLETVRRAKQIAKQVAQNLAITGPFNIQFIAKDNELKVIECNVRASRSFPFVSKVSGHNFIAIATEALLGIEHDTAYQTLELDHVAVKTPQFSYNRLKGADPVAGVEMASTGEVACFGSNVEEAFYISWLATEQHIKGKRVFISLPDEQKHKFIEEVRLLWEAGWKMYMTEGTHHYFKQHGITSRKLHKIREHREPSVSTAIQQRKLDLMINVPSAERDNRDAYSIRRLAIDNHIPLHTNPETGRLLLRCLTNEALQRLQPRHWQEYVPSMDS